MAFPHLLLPIVLSSVIAACASTQPQAAAPTAQVSNAGPHLAVVSSPHSKTTGDIINVTYDIRKACDLADSDAHFAFDSASVRVQDMRTLSMLADCFVSGPLRGRQMNLVGHADPRGAQDYNLALAGRRADMVKYILVAEKMIANDVSTTSRGAMDASGTDEVSWANDRSVDVTLGS